MALPSFVVAGENNHVGHTNEILKLLAGDPWVNAMAPPFNAKGDGVTDDRAAIQAAIDSISSTRLGYVYLPHTNAAGSNQTIYMVSSPLTIGSARGLIGPETGGSNNVDNGVTIRAKTGFTGTAIIKSTSWDAGINDWWHGGAIENLVIDCNDIAANGIAIHQLGEESLLRRVSAWKATESGFVLTGEHAVGRLEGCSAWHNNHYGFKFTVHPGARSVDGNGGTVTGTLSGDLNTLAHIYIDGSQKCTFTGIKSEGHTTGIIIAGSGVGGDAPALVASGYFNNGAGTGDLVKIQGTAEPIVLLLGMGWAGYSNIINDTVVSKTVPVLNQRPNLIVWGGSSLIGRGELILDKEYPIQGRHPSTGTPASLIHWASDQIVHILGRGVGGSLSSDNGTKRVQWNDTGVGFNGTAPVAKPTITGSRGGNAALASLLTALANRGDIIDSTTA